MRQPILFGKYYLLERVNVGGMAEIFKAKAVGVEGFERLVAVKRILPNIAEDEEFIDMFVDEAKIAVQLTHANIAQIFDLGKVGDSYFIALEYVSGKDLRAVFNRARKSGEPIPIPMACHAMARVCEALDYAHNKKDATNKPLNFVHRDVSPQNILVSYDGEIKVVDFGIAKAAGKASKTRAGILKGKFGYMSPEQVNGKEIDHRSDIFGVGICLYELLAGERLFAGESDFSTVERVRKADIMPPSTYNRRVPGELERIVMRALARDVDERYQTAMELHDELQAFAQESNNPFSRKNLSDYMRSVFAEELSQETARDQDYATLALPEPEETEEPEVDSLPVTRPGSLPASARRSRVSTARGIPVVQPGPTGPMSARPASSRPPPPPSRPPAPSVPPPIPRPQSIPPPHPSPQQLGGAVHSPSARIDMDWEDEELSTQIYDRPEGPLLPLGLLQQTDLRFGPQAGQPSDMPPPGPQPISAVPGEQTPAQLGDLTPAQLGEMAAPTLPSHPPDELDEPIEWPSPRRDLRPLALAAGGLLGVVVAILLAKVTIFRGPDTGTLYVSTDPRDAQVTVNNARAPGNTSPFVIPRVEADRSHFVQVSKSGYQTWSTHVQLEGGQTKQLGPIVLKPIESGFVLNSEPSGARVSVDGTEIAQFTPARVTTLTPGIHEIRLAREGYAPWQTQVHVVAGRILELPLAQLTPQKEGEPSSKRKGSPRTGSASSAAASDDADKPGQETSKPRPRDRRPTEPRPRDSRPTETTPADQDVGERKAGGETTKPSTGVVLLAKGTLRINTRPWSEVYVDGRPVGNTPLMRLELDPGSHKVRLVNRDFGIEQTITVNIAPGETVTKILNLQPGS